MTKLLHTLALRTRVEKEKLIHRIALRIHESLDLFVCLQTTVDEVRQFLQADRALVYCFDPQWNGYIPVESTDPKLSTSFQSFIKSPSQREYYAELLTAAPKTISDAAKLSAQGQSDFLSQLQISAQLMAPISKDKTLWGVLIVQQCHAPRVWQAWERDLLEKLSIQVGIALRQAELYAQSQTELAERKRIAKELELARDEAIAAMEAKSQFLAVMSHEIRTPLNGIIGMTGLLSDTRLTAEQRNHVTTIRSCSDNLLSLVNNVLDLTKVNAEGLELEKNLLFGSSLY